ncbi:MAG: phosphoglycerate kinase [Candidatus Omnitrophota bacterium]
MPTHIEVNYYGLPVVGGTNGIGLNFRKDRQRGNLKKLIAFLFKITGLTRYDKNMPENCAIMKDPQDKQGFIEYLMKFTKKVKGGKTVFKHPFSWVVPAEKGTFKPIRRGMIEEPFLHEDLTYGMISMPIFLDRKYTERFAPDVVRKTNGDIDIVWYWQKENIPEWIFKATDFTHFVKDRDVFFEWLFNQGYIDKSGKKNKSKVEELKSVDNISNAVLNYFNFKLVEETEDLQVCIFNLLPLDIIEKQYLSEQGKELLKVFRLNPSYDTKRQLLKAIDGKSFRENKEKAFKQLLLNVLNLNVAQISNSMYWQIPGLCTEPVKLATFEKIKNAEPGSVNLSIFAMPDLIGHVACKHLDKDDTTVIYHQNEDGSYYSKEGNGWDSVLEGLRNLDKAIGEVVEAAKKKYAETGKRVVIVVVGDHGSVNDMSNSGHTTDDAMAFIIDVSDEGVKLIKNNHGKVDTHADLSVTELHVLGRPVPESMKGKYGGKSWLSEDYPGDPDTILIELLIDGGGVRSLNDKNNAFGVAAKKGLIPNIKKYYYDRYDGDPISLKAAGWYEGLRGLKQEDFDKKEIMSRQGMLDLVSKVTDRQVVKNIKVVLYDYKEMLEATQVYEYADGLDLLSRHYWFEDMEFVINVDGDTITVLALDLPQTGSTEYAYRVMNSGSLRSEQIIRLIDKAMITGEIYKNPALKKFIEQAILDGFVYGYGIIQEEGVHASRKQQLAILDMLSSQDVEDWSLFYRFKKGEQSKHLVSEKDEEKLYFNLFLASDGRDGSKFYFADEDGAHAKLKKGLKFLGLEKRYSLSTGGREYHFDRAGREHLAEAFANISKYGSRVPRPELLTPEIIALSRDFSHKASSTGVRTLDDVEGQHRSAILVADWNLPVQNGVITDSIRYDETEASIIRTFEDLGVEYLFGFSHFGRPTKGKFEEKYSMKVVADYARERLKDKGIVVALLDYNEDFSVIYQQMNDFKNEHYGKKILFIFENIRFFSWEQPKNKEEEESAKKAIEIIKKITGATLFVNDAFAKLHRGKETSMQFWKVFDDENIVAGINVAKRLSEEGESVDKMEGPVILIGGGAKPGKVFYFGELAEQKLIEGDSVYVVGALQIAANEVNGSEVGRSLVPKKEKDLQFVRDGLKKLVKQSEMKKIDFHFEGDSVVGEVVEAFKEIVKDQEIYKEFKQWLLDSSLKIEHIGDLDMTQVYLMEFVLAWLDYKAKAELSEEATEGKSAGDIVHAVGKWGSLQIGILQDWDTSKNNWKVMLTDIGVIAVNPQTKQPNEISPEDIIVDIGPQQTKKIIAKIKSIEKGNIKWNGDPGWTEFLPARKATFAIIQAVSEAMGENPKLQALFFGGDTDAAIQMAKKAGIKINPRIKISDGGGVLYELWLKGKRGLPAVAALMKSSSEQTGEIKTSSSGQGAESLQLYMENVLSHFNELLGNKNLFSDALINVSPRLEKIKREFLNTQLVLLKKDLIEDITGSLAKVHSIMKQMRGQFGRTDLEWKAKAQEELIELETQLDAITRPMAFARLLGENSLRFDKALKNIDAKVSFQVSDTKDVQTVGTLLINKDFVKQGQEYEYIIDLFSKSNSNRKEIIARAGVNVVWEDEYDKEEDKSDYMVAITHTHKIEGVSSNTTYVRPFAEGEEAELSMPYAIGFAKAIICCNAVKAFGDVPSSDMLSDLSLLHSYLTNRSLSQQDIRKLLSSNEFILDLHAASPIDCGDEQKILVKAWMCA